MPRPLKIAHVGPCMLNGGTEVHMRSLVKFMDPARMRITSAVVTDASLVDPAVVALAGVPVAAGIDEVRKAAAANDVLLCWGGDLTEWLKGCRPKLTLFMAHGEGDWTRHWLQASRGISDHVVAVSRRVKERVCYDAETTVIPNGIDRARIAPTRPRGETRSLLGFAPGDHVLLYCGRFSDEKRPRVAIEALARLPANHKALMVGWGGMEGELRTLAEEFPARVRFATAVDDVGDTYAAADCLVLCSAEEGGPLVVTEAMFAGVPVIATPVGSVPEILATAPGSLALVDGTPAAVARATLRLAHNPSGAALQVARAKKYAEEHGHARTMAERYMDLIEALWARFTNAA